MSCCSPGQRIGQYIHSPIELLHVTRHTSHVTRHTSHVTHPLAYRVVAPNVGELVADWGLEFMVQGLEFRVQDMRFRACGLCLMDLHVRDIIFIRVSID